MTDMSSMSRESRKNQLRSRIITGAPHPSSPQEEDTGQIIKKAETRTRRRHLLIFLTIVIAITISTIANYWYNRSYQYKEASVSWERKFERDDTGFVAFLLGVLLLVLRPLRENAKARTAYVTASLLLECGAAVRTALGPGFSLTLGHLADNLLIAVKVDSLSRVFLVMGAAIWLLAGVFAFGYLRDDKRSGWFFVVYLLAFGALCGIACSANLVTLYLFFESLLGILVS